MDTGYEGAVNRSGALWVSRFTLICYIGHPVKTHCFEISGLEYMVPKEQR